MTSSGSQPPLRLTWGRMAFGLLGTRTGERTQRKRFTRLLCLQSLLSSHLLADRVFVMHPRVCAGVRVCVWESGGWECGRYKYRVYAGIAPKFNTTWKSNVRCKDNTQPKDCPPHSTSSCNVVTASEFSGNSILLQGRSMFSVLPTGMLFFVRPYPSIVIFLSILVFWEIAFTIISSKSFVFLNLLRSCSPRLPVHHYHHYIILHVETGNINSYAVCASTIKSLLWRQAQYW